MARRILPLKKQVQRKRLKGAKSPQLRKTQARTTHHPKET